MKLRLLDITGIGGQVILFFLNLCFIFFSSSASNSAEFAAAASASGGGGGVSTLNSLHRLYLSSAVESSAQFASLLSSADKNDTIRTVILTVSNNRSDLSVVHKALDDFLQLRLYWYIKSEPQAWQKHTLAPLVLSKISHRIEPFYRWKSAQQNPPSPEDCAKSPLLIFNGLDAWGAKSGEFSNDFSMKQMAIVGTYFSVNGEPSKSNAMFMDADACPTVIDKFLCAFLPTTYCAIPKSICTNGYCAGFDQGGSALFSKACIDGEEIKKTHKDYFSRSISWNGALPNADQLGKVVSIPPIQPGLRHSSLSSKPNMGGHVQDSVALFFSHSLMFRPNAFFRSRIQEALHEFRAVQKPSFSHSSSCTAIHIRRGDRAIESLTGQDMIDFCAHCKVNPLGFFSIAEKGINETCDFTSPGRPNYDQLGCHRGAQAFGAITLKMYLDAAAVANPNVNTVVVMTDSGTWLEKQIKLLPEELSKKWNIHSYPAADNHRSNHHKNGINFLTSLALMQQCDAFVGPISCSAATQYIFGSTCIRHGTGGEVKHFQTPTHYDICAK